MAVSLAIKYERPAPERKVREFCPVQLRAMALWPRLDRRSLRRCGSDPARIAAYVSRRTRMPVQEIEALLRS
jgi:hypothetical protein